jgi:hypothetical protein
MLPTGGLSNQVTAVLLVPLTEAAKVAPWPPFSEILPGDKLMLTGGGGGAE